MKNDTFLADAQKIVEEHVKNQMPINVHTLAQCMYLHPIQLYRKMKKAQNVSPSIFIQQNRLVHAKYLLENTTLKVHEIAFRVGFESHSYFSARFKAHFGHSPSTHQKKQVFQKKRSDL